MTNATVSDCKGILLDSELGANAGHYDHDENYTFSSCIPDGQVTLIFSSFCTEINYDSLRIFDGPDTLSPQIGPSYQGTVLPPTITSTGPCLTINFISDDNVSCTAWTAQWTTEIEEPQAPEMYIIPTTANCSTSTMTVNFNRPVHCDSLLTSHFSIGGPVGNTVTGVTPLNCTNDSTTSAQLNFNPGFNQSGPYTFTYTNYYIDACDS